MLTDGFRRHWLEVHGPMVRTVAASCEGVSGAPARARTLDTALKPPRTGLDGAVATLLVMADEETDWTWLALFVAVQAVALGAIARRIRRLAAEAPTTDPPAESVAER
jgi:hypothetical protein